MAEDPFKRGHGWVVLLDDVGELTGQLEESVFEVEGSRQVNHPDFHDFGATFFS